GALVEIHSREILHRDLTPANVFLCRDGAIKVLDFGISRPLESTPLTRSGVLMGTLLYLSPEVVSANQHSAAADIWALGAILYHALTGRPHVRPGETGGILAAIDGARFSSPDEIDPAIPG